MDEAQVVKRVTPEMERTAAQKARDRARAARWDLDVAIFLFGILAVLIILLFQGIGIGVVAPIATFGLAMVWLVGWRREKQLYPRFYEEELAQFKRDAGGVVDGLEETIEQRVQKALRERWR